ncbi:MAG TPA: pyridoxal-phosphate dependent enzyme [Pyrinomonadaceae bacterium]
MNMLTLDFIREAHARIAPHVHRTPVMSSRAFNREAGREVWFKCENFQRAGSFKMRGATNKILALDASARARGVAAFSSGNHAQAVALAARDAGTRAVIVMPEDAPRSKVAATRGYGAEIVFYDRQRDDRETVARDVAERGGLVLVPPYDDYHVMAGQGTCVLELLEEVRDLDAIVTPCGGGGLFAGASTAAKGIDASIRCLGVEPETGDDTRLSFLKGERVTIPPPPTIADGARVQSPGALTFPFVQRNAEDVLLVSDAELAGALKFLLFRLKILVEPTGALGVAAVLFNKLPANIRRIGVVISGGNVDADALARLVQ